MATINLLSKLQLVDSPDNFSLGGGTDTIAQVATGATTHVNDQSVGTASEVLNIGDLSYPLYVHFENLDPTNFVGLAVDNANATNFAKLLGAGGKAGPFLAQSPIYLKADTGACVVRCGMTKP